MPSYNISPKKKHLEKLTFCIVHRFNIGTYDYDGFLKIHIKGYYTLNTTNSVKNILYKYIFIRY